MKRLGLLRHAKSDWGVSIKRDFDRGVNAKGRRGAALIGERIRGRHIAWDLVLASPAQRVRTTLAQALPGQPVQWDERLYLAETDTIIEVLRECGGAADAVLLAGHNPGLGDLVSELVDPAQENALFDEARLKFPTAAFALFELAIDDWSALHGGCGRLVHFARPRDLDPALGPEN